MRTTAHEDQFRTFVVARSQALLRVAYLLTGDRGLAEDLLQTSLAKTYAAWPRIRDGQAVEAYVRTVMTRTVISWRRRNRVREDPVWDVPESAAPREQQPGGGEELWADLQALPRRQRAVLVLRYYEDLSEAQIAEVLGCSRGTVKSQASRGLATLRRRLLHADAEELAQQLTMGEA